MTSIRRWLLRWLIFGLAAACLVAGFGIFHTARLEASELFDYELRTVAISLPMNIAATDSARAHPATISAASPTTGSSSTSGTRPASSSITR